MTISGKPKKNNLDKHNIDVEALINKGGSVPAKDPQTETTQATTSESKLHLLQLRLPPDTIAQIDTLINKRRVKPSRHTWFLEAIYEKIDREIPS